MSSYEIKPDEAVLGKPNKILLMGNPNVGKSIFFTELTGVHAISSNYAGTTVTFTEGELSIGGESYTLIDVPGTYSLAPTSEAEAVATRFMQSGAKAVICVLDATNIERNLRLALALRRYEIPLVYALNLVDVAERQGVAVNAKLLSQELGAPVVETVAIKKIGLSALKEQLKAVIQAATGHPLQAGCGHCGGCVSEQPEDDWEAAREIARRVSARKGANPSWMDRLSEKMMRPLPGIPIALLVMALSMGVIVGVGETLRGYLLEPLVDEVIVPFFRNVFTTVLPPGFVQNILVGEFGVFVISFEWIVALILPYVFLFYIVFTFLEDTGYLPRISILFDNVMRKLGVQGGSLMYMLMGYGCAAPAIIGSRAATSRKERIVISTAVCFSIPCISQTGALIALLSGYAWWMLPAMAAFSLLLFVAVTLAAGKLVKGRVDPLLIEVPNLLIPSARSYLRKLLTRMKHFLKDAEGPILIAIVIVAIVSEAGLLAAVAVYAQPLVSGWLGLPPDAVTALILGVVRREMSVAPLLALNLTSLQAFVGGVVSLMYLPCLSAFAILNKEFRTRIALTITLSTIVAALFVGGVINQIGRLFV